MSGMMLPIDAIERDPPNVWLTSFYGFDPGNWGYLGFSVDAQRNGFLKRTEPGVLVVVYASGKAPKDMLGRVVGVLQCSHRVNNAKAFMSPVAWETKQKDPDRAGRWELAVKATRAWRVAPDERPLIQEFAHETYLTSRAQAIGSQGMRLTANEARHLLSLTLQEVTVFGEDSILASSAGTGLQLFAPSKPGPVSQSSYTVREAEGPKSLYILALAGNLNTFLGRSIPDDMLVIKVGMSKSPAVRCLDHNLAWPACAFTWSILKENRTSGVDRFPSSRPAICGENAMKSVLASRGECLRGEFFLARRSDVEAAWEEGLAAAHKWMTAGTGQ